MWCCGLLTYIKCQLPSIGKYWHFGFGFCSKNSGLLFTFHSNAVQLRDSQLANLTLIPWQCCHHKILSAQIQQIGKLSVYKWLLQLMLNSNPKSDPCRVAVQLCLSCLLVIIQLQLVSFFPFVPYCFNSKHDPRDKKEYVYNDCFSTS